MSQDLSLSDERPLFAAELTPYRSLGRRGFRIVLLIAGAVTIGYGGFFIATGAIRSASFSGSIFFFSMALLNSVSAPAG